MPTDHHMLRRLLGALTGRSEHRTTIHRVTQLEPLQRFKDAEYFEYFKQFAPVAKALAVHTEVLVAAILEDEDVPEWQRAGGSATPTVISDLAAFFSHALIAFASKELRATGSRMDAALRAELSYLVRLMFGDLTITAGTGGLTLDRLLAERAVDDPLDILDLTYLVDRLLGVKSTPNNARREAKTRKLEDLLMAHSGALAYRLHGIL